MKIDRSILPPGKIGLAVSGGSDSVALAFLLTKGGKKKNASKRFVVLHVDHGLRKESREEYRFVRSLAKRLGIPFKGIHAKVVKRRGESLEMAARRVRLAFFSKCMKSLKLDAVATGHHMDDVAETFLMKLRRASLSGIRATSEVAGIKFVRPLLGCRDDELKDYLRKFGEEWREDASDPLYGKGARRKPRRAPLPHFPAALVACRKPHRNRRVRDRLAQREGEPRYVGLTWVLDLLVLEFQRRRRGYV